MTFLPTSKGGRSLQTVYSSPTITHSSYVSASHVRETRLRGNEGWLRRPEVSASSLVVRRPNGAHFAIDDGIARFLNPRAISGKRCVQSRPLRLRQHARPAALLLGSCSRLMRYWPLLALDKHIFMHSELRGPPRMTTG